MIWLFMLGAVTAFLIVPELRRNFIQATLSHPYVMGFVKFTVLASMGELLTIRLMTGNWRRPSGFAYKAVIWGVIGLGIVLMFGLFNEGVAGATIRGLLPGAPGVAGRLLQAFFTSTFLNLTFAPVFMAAHRISDTLIDLRAEGKRQSVNHVIKAIDWPEFFRFVVGKTIPFFWIPVQTINFMLPAHYRIIVAAYLSIVLGIILAYARRK